MLGSELLEVAIGLVFVFLLVSVICSAVREGIESWLKTRAAYLERGIRELLQDKNGRGLARSFYEHPLVFSLYPGGYSPGKTSAKLRTLARGGQLPSYIPASTFATALLDIAARGPDSTVDLDSPPLTLQSVRANILNIENEAVQRALLSAVDTAEGDLDRAKQSIQDWYDSAMDRVSGWYKRCTQRIIFGIGLVVAVGLNINTLTLVDYLYRQDAARSALVARAERAAADSTVLSLGYDQARAALDSLSLPIGWSRGYATVGWRDGALETARSSGQSWFYQLVLVPLLGWVMTALAATMGAPFWFDLLNKVMVIRSTVKPKEKSPEEGSEDRQPKGRGATSDREVARVAAAAGAAAGGAAGAAAGGAAAAPHDPATGGPPRDPHLAAEEALDDGCDVPITRATRDEDLPAARGGVS